MKRTEKTSCLPCAAATFRVIHVVLLLAVSKVPDSTKLYCLR